MQLTEPLQRYYANIYRQIDNRSPFEALAWNSMLGHREASHFERLFAETIEENSGHRLTKRSVALRDIVCDLGTLSWDFRYASACMAFFGEQSLSQQFTYLRFLVEDIFENWSGARDFVRLIAIGGVRKDLKLGDQKYLGEMLTKIERELEESLEFLLFDPLLQENLIDLSHNFPTHLSDLSLWWPDLYYRKTEALERVSENLLQLYRKYLEQRPIAASEGQVLASLFRFRVYRILANLSELRQSLTLLPEGKHRVFVDHLHIPGNRFLSQSLVAPSGRLYSYYCSGKYRVTSFSQHFLEVLKSSIYGQDLNVNAWLKILGVDRLQGVNCADPD